MMSALAERDDHLVEYASRGAICCVRSDAFDERRCSCARAAALPMDEKRSTVSGQPPLADHFCRVISQLPHASHETGDERGKFSGRELGARGTTSSQKRLDALRAPGKQSIMPVDTTTEINHAAHMIRIGARPSAPLREFGSIHAHRNAAFIHDE